MHHIGVLEFRFFRGLWQAWAVRSRLVLFLRTCATTLYAFGWLTDQLSPCTETINVLQMFWFKLEIFFGVIIIGLYEPMKQRCQNKEAFGSLLHVRSK